MGFRRIGLIAVSICVSLVGCGDDAGSGTCGNGIVEIGEFCDDGNSATGDGCAPDCLFERGPDAAMNMIDADPGQPDGTPLPDADPNQPDGSSAAAVINEILPNPTGGPPDNAEFVEVFGPPNTDFSNLTIVTVDGEVPGRVNAVIPVGVTDANGLFSPTPGDLGIQNGTETFLLIDGFTGAVGGDVDSNDNGMLDQGIGTVIDSVAILDNSGAGETYSSVVLLPDHPPVNGQVDGAGRFPDGADTDTVDDWVHTDETGNISGAAAVTPGALNALIP